VGAATRNDFELDVANLLRTYKNTFLSNRKGRKGSCIELRFKPLVVSLLRPPLFNPQHQF
jgi:hypothetical protein